MIFCSKCRAVIRAKFTGSWFRCPSCGTKHYVSRIPK